MRLKKVLLAVPVVAALALAGCSSGSGDAKQSDQDTGNVESGDGGAAAGELITTNGTEPQRPLIPSDVNEVGGGRIVDMLFAGLVYYTPEGAVENEAAESIETEDSQHYTVTLKEGQTFSDGTPVTASSFVDAWNTGASKEHLSAYFYSPIEGTDEEGKITSGDTMSGLEVIDDQTFTITLKQPESDFPLRLGYSAFYPLPESTLKDLEKGGNEPIGNGPYKVSDKGWVHNEGIELIPSESYTGGRASQNDGIYIRFYTDLGPAYNDLLSGQLDVLQTVPEDATASFQEELGDRALNQAAALNQTITIPQRLKHFEGEEGILRRQAISKAINRPEITSAIFNDTRTPARDFTSPVIAGYDPNLENASVLDFDPEGAQELWAKADEISKWEGKFEIAYNSDGPHAAWVEAVANQLKNNLGIEAEGHAYPDFKSLRDEVTSRSIETAFRTGWQADYPSLSNFLGPLFATGAGSNDGDYSNPVFDALLVDAAAAATPEEGNAKIQEAQEVLLNDLPAIPLWYQNETGGFSEAVSNVQLAWNSVPVYYLITRN